MKPEEQRIAIVQALGWKIVRVHFAQVASPDGRLGHCCGLHLDDLAVWRGHFYHHAEKPLLLPDFLNDLNATREMEKSLGEFGPEVGRYVSWLGGIHSNPGMAMWACRHATAAQCAEAFLRAKNLWTD